MNLQNTLNYLTENVCLKDFTVFKHQLHPCEVGQIFTFSSIWVSISRKTLFLKLQKLRGIKSPFSTIYG